MKCQPHPESMCMPPVVKPSEMVKEELLLERMIGENSIIINLKKDIILEKIPLKICGIQGSIGKTKFYLKEDRIIFKGKFEGNIAYLNVNNCVSHHPFQVSFQDCITVPGALPNMKAVVKSELLHIARKQGSYPCFSQDAQNILPIKVSLKFSVIVSQYEHFPVIAGNNSVPFAEQLLVLTPLFRGKWEKNIILEHKKNVSFSTQQIKNIHGKITGFSTQIYKNKVKIKGVIQQHIRGICDGEYVYYHEEEIPFQTAIQIEHVSEITEIKVRINLLALNWRYVPEEKLVIEEILMSVIVIGLEKRLVFLPVLLEENPLSKNDITVLTKTFWVDKVRAVNTISFQKQYRIVLGRYVKEILNHQQKIVTRNSHIVSQGILWEGELKQHFVFLTHNNNYFKKTFRICIRAFIPLLDITAENKIESIAVIDDLQIGLNHDCDMVLGDMNYNVFVIATERRKANIIVDIKIMKKNIKTLRWFRTMLLNTKTAIKGRFSRYLLRKR